MVGGRKGGRQGGREGGREGGINTHTCVRVLEKFDRQHSIARFACPPSLPPTLPPAWPCQKREEGPSLCPRRPKGDTGPTAREGGREGGKERGREGGREGVRATG